MKITFSPLITAASGKVGPLVASRWKGIPYIRSHVIPANPNSLGEFGQQEHRARCAMLVHWWQSLETAFTDFVGELASGMAMSGFNLFMNRNLYLISLGTKAQRKSAEHPEVAPQNTDVEEIATLVTTTGDAGKKIALDWTQGNATAEDIPYVLYGTADADGDLPIVLEGLLKDTGTIADLSGEITVLEAETMYCIMMLVETAAGGEFSIALVDWATSSAAA